MKVAGAVADAEGAGIEPPTRRATLMTGSRCFGSWSLPSWLMCRLAGVRFDDLAIAGEDSIVEQRSPEHLLVPSLTLDDVVLTDDLAIAEYLDLCYPEAELLPADGPRRHETIHACMRHAFGFRHLRSSAPMNLSVRRENLPLWSGAARDLEELVSLWRKCIDRCGGPYLFGAAPNAADAIAAPFALTLLGYGLDTDPVANAYGEAIHHLPDVQVWVDAALLEETYVDPFEMEF